MVTKKEIFITSDGKEFEQEDNAILRERILEKHRKINATQKALKKLKEGCTHGKVSFYQDLLTRHSSGDDGSGGTCVVGTLYFRNALCCICGQGLEYQYNEDKELVQIVNRW